MVFLVFVFTAIFVQFSSYMTSTGTASRNEDDLASLSFTQVCDSEDCEGGSVHENALPSSNAISTSTASRNEDDLASLSFTQECDSKDCEVGFVHDNTLPSFNATDTVQILVEDYRGIVKDHLSLFQSTWVRHNGMHLEPTPFSSQGQGKGATRTGKNDRKNQREKVQFHHQNNESAWDGFLDEYSNEQNNQPDHDAYGLDDIEWDSENDISGYFDMLTSACKKSRSKVPNPTNFERCWGMLHRIVHQPLCTTRLDSRVSCSGDRNASLGLNFHSGNYSPDIRSTVDDRDHNQKNLSWKGKGVQMIKEHFLSDTVNVVIIGGGPSGLALANALTEAQVGIGSSTATTKANIRVVLFENRLEKHSAADAPGRKKRYERDWITELFRQLFIDRENNAFDPRLGKLLKQIQGYKRDITLPICILETLLLLSNRSRSHVVKILYDDYQNYKDVLDNSQNLVVFDATGHRLNALRRPSVNDSVEQKKLNLHKYTPDSYASDRLLFRKVLQSHIDMLEDHRMPLTIAEFDTTEVLDGDERVTGTISYPVSPHTLMPYHMAYVKVNSLAHSDSLLHLHLEHYTESNPLCGKNKDEDDYAREWCGPNFMYDMSSWYNEESSHIMKERSCGFSLRTAVLNLNPAQTKELQMLIAHYGDIAISRRKKNKSNLGQNPTTSTGDSNEVSILDIPPIEIMARHRLFKNNDVGKILIALMENEIRSNLKHEGEKYEPEAVSSFSTNAKISTFEYHPYIYTDPLYHTSFFGDDVPVLRIGESLLSGDANGSTGLEMHLFMILKLKCKLMNRKTCMNIWFEKEH